MRVDPDRLFGRHLAVLGNTDLANHAPWQASCAGPLRLHRRRSMAARLHTLDSSFSTQTENIQDASATYQEFGCSGLILQLRLANDS